MTDPIIQRTSMEGLHWEANPTVQSGVSIQVAHSFGAKITDFVTHDSNFKYDQYGIHVGQVDRLTFFGPLEKKIVGYFIDCRKGSPTLHETEKIEWSPDPGRKLVIDRGIAHTFDGLENIVTRDEPIWFVSENNSDYSMANDVVNFPRNEHPSRFPIVVINELPIPDVCYDFVTTRQHETFKNLSPVYPVRFKMKIAGQSSYVIATPKL